MRKIISFLLLSFVVYALQAQIKDPDSVYNYYKKLIHLRKEKDIMVYGTYELLDPEDEALYVYTRTLGDQKLLVMCNFTKEEQEYTVPETFAGADVLISNYPQLSLIHI